MVHVQTPPKTLDYLTKKTHGITMVLVQKKTRDYYVQKTWYCHGTGLHKHEIAITKKIGITMVPVQKT